MKATGRRAVVARDYDGLWLFKAGLIVRGIAGQKTTLADLDRNWPVHLASGQQITRHNLDLVDPLAEPSVAERFLDQIGRSYLLGEPQPLAMTLGADPAIIMVSLITRREILGIQLLGAPADCYCTDPSLGDDPHQIDPPIPADGLCPLDGSPIVCAK